MRTFTAVALSALAILPYVSAHGFLSNLVIDGTSYKGNLPNATPNPSVVRQISSVDPVKGTSNANLNCGQDAQKASLLADAQPGSSLSFFWMNGDSGNWVHNTGPVMTYLASCGDTTCDQFDSTQAKWFKIDEAGQDSSGAWAQATLNTGAPINVTLPSNLASGNYLVRHEIIALQLAMSVGGAEFYPSCSQLKVGGSGTGVPDSSELVSFPGAYSDNDPGILDTDVYTPGAAYTFPGPKVATFAAGSTPSSGSPVSTPSSAAASTSASVAVASSTAASATQSSSAAATRTCKPGQKRMVKRHTLQWSH
ncbi:glycosyl hydrolase family 61-domain-containing protein [Cytidiella melzeri]|nr:glycosyl hydrolase family 61-domain-containing protein [Cytidiella melzeri]